VAATFLDKRRYSIVALRILAANPLGAMALRFQRFHDEVAMIALHFDDTILDRAAGSASRAQLLAKQGQGNKIECQPLNECHNLAAAAF
jgi:hypothetical protein